MSTAINADGAKEQDNKKNLLWNMAASVVNAAEAVIIIMVASRINEIGEAGVLSIAFSLANLFMMIGKFGVKNYQVSHDGYDVGFASFVKLRVLTVLMMIASLAVFLFYQVFSDKYTLTKAAIIAGVAIWYTIEAFEDVFVVHLQTTGKLHVGNKVFIIRWCLIFVGIVLTDCLTRNLILSIAVADILALVSEIMCLIFVAGKYEIKCTIQNIKIFNLMLANIPLCVSEVLYFYINNVPKFVIDQKMDDIAQAIYGYISVPVFAISLINSIIYQPFLMGYVRDLRENRIGSFVKKIMQQTAIIGVIMLVCLTGAYLIGIQVISALYGVDLRQYRALMLMLLVGGGALAVGGFMQTILVIMNKRKTAMAVYLWISLFASIVTFILVGAYKLPGAVMSYVLTMSVMAVSFVITVVMAVKKTTSAASNLNDN